MNATRSISLAQLLQVEDDVALFDFQCPETGILWWPLARTIFLRFAMSDFLYGTPLDGSVSRGVPASRALATMSRSVLNNLGLRVSGRAQASICLMTSGVGHQMTDGKLLNRLSDHFALAWPDETLTVEEHFQWIWPSPRHNRRVMMHAPLQARNALGARLRVNDSHRRRAASLVKLAAGRAQSLLGWRPGPQREGELADVLARKVAGLTQQVRNYEGMLSVIRPRLLLTLAGCYGASAALIRAARHLDIVTAEYQHGTLSGGHDGYNFGPALRDNAAFRSAIPEHFLSYGTWWNEQVNAPVRMTAVGNPHRDYRCAQARLPQSKDTILILSDGTEFSLYLALARQLAPQAHAKGLQVVIRPHPLERSLVLARHGNDSSIRIDPNEDLYTSLGGAHAVVSELSTGLFEAVGLAEKLFVWDTPKARFGFPTFPFQPFKNADELIELLSDDRAGRLDDSKVEATWSTGWRDNYASFLERHCGLRSSILAKGANV